VDRLVARGEGHGLCEGVVRGKVVSPRQELASEEEGVQGAPSNGDERVRGGAARPEVRGGDPAGGEMSMSELGSTASGGGEGWAGEATGSSSSVSPREAARCAQAEGNAPVGVGGVGGRGSPATNGGGGTAGGGRSTGKAGGGALAGET
jgi:hypothetical protein